MSEPAAQTSRLASATPSRASSGVTFAISALVAAGFALTLLVFYPGYMTNDAGYVYQFMKDRRYGDWQSPLMSILWGLIDPIAPGPASMFLLVAATYWLGFAIFAWTVARRSIWLGLLVPLLALTPPAFMFLGMIWRDILFGVVWLLAAVIVHAGADREKGPRLASTALALILVGFGVLLRPTAIASAPLLAAYLLWPARFDLKRAAILFLPALAIGYALIHLVYYVILDVKREHPLHSVFVFDLAGITHFSGENQFPVSWSPEETALLTGTCYKPDRWDRYWTMEPCKFVMQRLERPDDVIFGTPRLIMAWERAVIAHPLAYLQHRLAYFWTFVADRNALTLELFHADDPAKTPLANNPRFKMLLALHDALKSTILFLPALWLAIAAAVCALAWRGRATPAGAFAIATAGSGVVYLLTYLPFGVAAEVRYDYWCVLAALVGAVAAVLAQRKPANLAAAAPA